MDALQSMRTAGMQLIETQLLTITTQQEFTVRAEVNTIQPLACIRAPDHVAVDSVRV
jgi:hypothetical protein